MLNSTYLVCTPALMSSFFFSCFQRRSYVMMLCMLIQREIWQFDRAFKTLLCISGEKNVGESEDEGSILERWSKGCDGNVSVCFSSSLFICPYVCPKFY